MSMNDALADMLTRIRNGQQARLAQVSCPASNLLSNVLEVLKDEGYIREYAKNDNEDGKPTLVIGLKYHDGEPVIRQVKRISTPGRRVYSGKADMPRIHNGLGIAVLSTSKGVMSDYKARLEGVGGEVLCSVF